MGLSDPNQSTLVVKQEFGPWRWIFVHTTFEMPTYNLFSDRTLLIGVQTSCVCVLNSKLSRSVSRSRSPKLISPASFPRTDITTTVACSTPSRVYHLVSDSPSHKKRDTKLQAIQAKFAKQVQQRKEATSRLNTAARIVHNTWKHDAKYRRRMKVKKQAEKTVRFSTNKLQFIRKEEMDILSRLEKKRRRNCERWAYAHDLSHGTG